MAEPTNNPVARFRAGDIPTFDDGRMSFPAAERNLGPICDALADLMLGASGPALEIGSGTGQHVCQFARRMPGLGWTPTDPEDVHLSSIRAWIAHEGVAVADPLPLDGARKWSRWSPVRALGPLRLIFSANVIHIAPWVVAQGIFAGAGQVLAEDGQLAFYGPFKSGGVHNSDGNVTFDARLRDNDPAWGIRDLDDLDALAAGAGLVRQDEIAMPANNRIIVYGRIG